MGSGTPAYGKKTTHYGQAFMNITRAPRWRSLIIGTISLLLVLTIWKANADPYSPGRKLYSKISGKPAHKDYMWEPPSEIDHAEIPLDSEKENTSIGTSGLLKQGSRQFHLLMHAPTITTNVCRSLLSSFLLDYPPPTLVGYRPSLSTFNNSEVPSFLLDNGIPDAAQFLSSHPKIRSDDYVLLVEGESTIFQLPIEALLDKYNSETAEANEQLEKEYHDIPVKTLTKQKLQRFNQSVLFAAEYEIVPLPQDTFLSRFRLPAASKASPVHLNNDLLMGSGSSLRRLFTTAADQNTRIERTDEATFNTMYSQQILHRLSTAQELRRVKSWIKRNVLKDAKEKKTILEDYATAKQDLGIGLDYLATMFQSIPPEAQDVTSTFTRLNETEKFSLNPPTS